MLMTPLAAAALAAAPTGIGSSAERTCVVQLANGASHSSISQRFAVASEEALRAESSLSLAQANGDFDIEFYLVDSPANDIRAYPTDGGFQVFYVLKQQDQSSSPRTSRAVPQGARSARHRPQGGLWRPAPRVPTVHSRC